MPTAWPSRPGRAGRRSLARVFEVLAADRPGAFQPPEVWKLDAWALRGVLLLNPVLTVEVGVTGSHMDCGWQALTVEIVKVLSRRASPPTFLLWGAKAQAFWASADPGAGAGLPSPATLPTTSTATFMRDGSHFEATCRPRRLVGHRKKGRPRAIVTGSSRRGARVAKGGRL